MEALDEGLKLLRTISEIEISNDQEKEKVLDNYINSADKNREKYREEYKSSGSVLTMFDKRFNIVIKELNRLKQWESLRKILGDVLFSNNLEASEILCRYLNRAEQFAITRNYIDSKNLKRKLSGRYVQCLEHDIKNTVFPSKQRIQIHQSIESFSDKLIPLIPFEERPLKTLSFFDSKRIHFPNFVLKIIS